MIQYNSKISPRPPLPEFELGLIAEIKRLGLGEGMLLAASSIIANTLTDYDNICMSPIFHVSNNEAGFKLDVTRWLPKLMQFIILI